MSSAREIQELMLSQDGFSQWLGLEIIEAGEGHSKVGMTIRPEMLNGMHKAHGGITFSLADSCFGFAANSHGRFAVSIEASINHIKALDAGDYITAETKLDYSANKLGYDFIEIKRGAELVAIFKGVVYKTKKNW